MVVQEHPACQPDQGEIAIDTLSFTLDLAAIGDYALSWQLLVPGLSGDPNDNFFVWQAFDALTRTIFGDVFSLAESFGSGRNFFNHSISLSDGAGFIAFGGNNTVVDRDGQEVTKRPRMQFYITGDGCARVKDWERVYRVLSEELSHCYPRITRVDIAYDDHDGRRDTDFARDLYMAGAFAGNGRPPKGQYIDDMDTGQGCTMYVGTRQTGRYLRVYEKGKQLGDPNSRWVRWEIELSAKQYDIPLQVLVRARETLAGSYQCLDWISNAKLIIQTAQKREKIEFQTLCMHGRRSYGKLIHYMISRRGMTPDQVVDQLMMTGVPGRLIWTVKSDSVGEVQSADKTHPHLYSQKETVSC